MDLRFNLLVFAVYQPLALTTPACAECPWLIPVTGIAGPQPVAVMRTPMAGLRQHAPVAGASSWLSKHFPCVMFGNPVR